MLKYIDNLLDHITMYRLLLYYLIALVLIAMGLSAAGVLHFSVGSIAMSTIILVVTCYILNKIFAAIFAAPTNVESVYITALILALIIAPINRSTPENLTFLLAASGLAIASKYILTINKKHIFNPAAIAVVLTALGPRQSANWWIGTTAMLPYVLIGGILLIRKIRRVQMVVTFFVATLLSTIVYTMLAKGSVGTSLHNTIFTSAMFFLGFVMLTEPLTTPPTAKKQKLYAILTGLLFPPQFHIFSIYSTPELALVTSNVFAYIISPKAKLFPTLKQKRRLTPDTVDFVFDPKRTFRYQAGQYMEWTLQHPKTDSRGNRRILTLASSPTESDLRVGVKFHKGGSSFKRALLDITPQTPIVAAQISGDFVLPKDPKQKIVFIAGGIGITPFRSMIKYLIDRNEPRVVTLLYSARTTQDFAYKEVFEEARQKLGLRTIYAVTGTNQEVSGEYMHHGRITAGLIHDVVPDFRERLFYVSGTQDMVVKMKSSLQVAGVPSHQIKVDYFSGYA